MSLLGLIEEKDGCHILIIPRKKYAVFYAAALTTQRV